MAYYIEEYEGTYKAHDEDETNTSDPDKSIYYPGKGVMLEFRVEEHTSYRQVDPVTTKVLRGKLVGGKWEAKEEFENARFYFHGGIVVSDPILTSVPNKDGGENLRVTEAIMLLNDGSMEHQLMWEDGDFGRWGCGNNG